MKRHARMISLGIVVFLAGLSALRVSLAAEQQRRARQQPARSPFANWDKDKDGFLSREEFPGQFAKNLFDRIDADKDGRISRKEDDDFRAQRRSGQQAAAQGKQRPSTHRAALPPGTREEHDIVYARVGERDLLLDLYRPPETSGPLPVVVWIHGGGWRGGSKDSPGRALPIVARGYALVSVGYRLSGEAIFPAAVEDCKAAIRWIRANAQKHGLDPDRIGVWGSSAGGHLVAFLGTAGDAKEFDTDANPGHSSRVRAVCDWFGPTDFLRMNDFPGRINHDGPESPESRFIGGPIQENKEKVAKANPITYVSEDDPPFLIMHGEKDQAVPYNQSELLYEALKKAGVEATLYRVKDGDHGFRGASQDSPEDLFEMAARFFDKHLKKP